MAFIDHYLYILSLGRVAAIDKKTGDIKWEVNLKDIASISSMGYSIGQIVLKATNFLLAVPVY